MPFFPSSLVIGVHLRREHAVEAVTDEEECQNGEDNGNAGEGGNPPALLHVLFAMVDNLTPADDVWIT